MEWIHGVQMKHGVLNLKDVDFGSVYGMRRAFSEGDIKVFYFYFYFKVFAFLVRKYDNSGSKTRFFAYRILIMGMEAIDSHNL